MSAAFESAVQMLRAADVEVADGSIELILDKLVQVDEIGTFPSIELAATLTGRGISGLDGIDLKTRARIEASAGVGPSTMYG